MHTVEAVLLGVTTFFATTLPALADGLHREVPEPDMLVLLGLAAAGVIIGRRMAYRKPPRD